MEKFLTMADKVLNDITKINSIIEDYNVKIEANEYDSEDLIRVEREIKYLKELLKVDEPLYIHYKENNEPYLEPDTYKYFKNLFSKETDILNLILSFKCKISATLNDDITPSKKVKILKNLVKSYEERENEILCKRLGDEK